MTSQGYSVKGRPVVPVGVVVVGFGTALIWAVMSGSVLSGQTFSVTAGEGVNIDQQDTNFNATPQDISNTGVVAVNYATLESDSGLSSGYLNISDSAGWVVQNLPVLPGLSGLSTSFNLGTADGTAVSNLSADVQFSSSAVTSFSGGSNTNFAVQQEQYDDQGEGANPSAGTPPPAGPITFSINGNNRFALQLGHPNVDAADNQCGPAAFANELSYLSTTYGLNIPETNAPGRGDPSTNTVYVPDGPNTATEDNELSDGDSLVGQLDLSMNRPSTSRVSGNDTTGAQQLTGVVNYLTSPAQGDSGKVKILYEGLGAVAGLAPGIAVTNKGNVDTTFAYNQLAAGATVKMGMSGHAVDVISAGSILGAPFLVYQSDLAQTPLDSVDNLLWTAKDAAGNPLPYVAQFSFLAPVAGGGYTLSGETGNPSVLNFISMQVVPEPGCLVSLLAAGGLVLLARRRMSSPRA